MSDRGENSQGKRPAIPRDRTGRWFWSWSGECLDGLPCQTQRDIGGQRKLPGIGKGWFLIVGNMKNDRLGENGPRTGRDTDGRNFVITDGVGDEPEAQQPNIPTPFVQMLRLPEPYQFQARGTFRQGGNGRPGIPDGDQQLEGLPGFGNPVGNRCGGTRSLCFLTGGCIQCPNGEKKNDTQKNQFPGIHDRYHFIKTSEHNKTGKVTIETTVQAYQEEKRSPWITSPGLGSWAGLGFRTFFLGGSKVCFHCFWTSLMTTFALL